MRAKKTRARGGSSAYRYVKPVIRSRPPRPPGSVAMLGIATVIFARQKVRRDFLPIISDYRLEYEEARVEGRLKALVVVLVHWWGFAKAVGLDKLLGLVWKVILKINGS